MDYLEKKSNKWKEFSIVILNLHWPLAATEYVSKNLTKQLDNVNIKSWYGRQTDNADNA